MFLRETSIRAIAFRGRLQTPAIFDLQFSIDIVSSIENRKSKIAKSPHCDAIVREFHPASPISPLREKAAPQTPVLSKDQVGDYLLLQRESQFDQRPAKSARSQKKTRF